MSANEREPLLGSSTDDRIGRLLHSHHVTQSAQEHPDYPIDHGTTAWLQVLGGWILFANSWGLPNAFGVFQTYYVDTLLPDRTASSIAWIGSLQLFFTTMGCLPGGMLLDNGYLKSTIVVGTALEIVGLLLMSFSKSYWTMLLAQGVCMGIGSGLLAIIPVVVLAMFFEKKRMVATGLASTGASIAGVAYTLSMRSLFTSLGFAWATRIFALMMLVTNVMALAVMRLQLQNGSKGSSFCFHHFTDLPYTVFVGAFALLVASSLVPFLFMQEYALQLGVSKNKAFNLLSIMNAANVFGRFMPNFLADRFGGVNTLIPLSTACMVTLCLLPLAQSANALVGISIVYGFLSGGVMSIPGPTMTHLWPSSAEMGMRLGLAYLVASFGGLLGNALIGHVKGSSSNAVHNFQAMAPLRIGFVPEHFSAPLAFAQKHHGLGAQLLPYPSGTGHMVTALQAGDIDVGVGLTEGWVAAMGKAQLAKADAGFRAVGTYVETPLCWAISTGAARHDLARVHDLKGKKVGVSRIGSGSYVMSFVLADQQGWLDTTSDRPPFPVEPLDTFANLRAAVNDGTADFFMWEHFTSKRYYDTGEIKRLGDIYTPWSSWKIVAANALVHPDDATKPALSPELEDALDKINKGVKHFEDHPEEAVHYISTSLDYSEEDAREWLKTVRFATNVRGVDPDVVRQTVSTLQKAGVLGDEVRHADMIALERGPSAK
ncbi:hypothetical protein ACEQ8H_004681 [Pleosporales sp. CAS-2024a]